MKRTLRKGWSLLLALALVVVMLPLGAAGAEPEDYVYQWGDGTESYSLLRTQETLGGGELGVSKAPAFRDAAGAGEDGTMYAQLTPRQKSCYDALNSIPLSQILTAAEVGGYRQVRVRADEAYGISLTGSMSDGVYRPDSASSAAYRSLYTDICAAITALRYDRADALWLSDMSYGILCTTTDRYHFTTGNVVFAFRLFFGGQEGVMYQRQMESAQAIAAQVNRNADRYDQLLQVYDMLADQSTYNYEALEEQGTMMENLSHMAYSCLVAGDQYEPVCDGYSKAFKVICDLLEIPCVLVSSDTHMWNNVKMEDGWWYNLDLTWDDTGDAGYHDFFLVGSQTVVDGTVFSAYPAHVEVNPWQTSSDLNNVVFTFPNKNTAAYVPVEGGYEPPTFPDVLRGNWYYEYVEDAADMGLFSGDETGKFNPKKNITRAEFVQVLYNAIQPDYTLTQSQFSDVGKDAWYAAAVNWAADSGVVSGKGEGRFSPNAFITREEMCVVLNNYITNVLGMTSENDGYLFADDSAISDWAKNAVYHAYSLGLVSGKGEDSFDPQGNTLRCEAAAVYVKLARLAGLDPSVSKAA
ncbi:MAG: S-layer homology domain-containing protein [Acutalibacter sp.]|jgi:hypothetical protein